MVAQPEQTAVGRRRAVLHLPILTVTHHRLDHPEYPLAVALMDTSGPEPWFLDPALDRVAEQGLRAAADEDEAPGGHVEGPDDGVDALDELAVVLL
ncbi:MAG: hypothetical protein A2X52_12190 [Candidatus Rokubacteria bacterium GWC2_70_16]|nr:MAG: hypothetical protein A2X52_12190 [Candidatus Rokubacteria bacterium GWC2_70_16]